MSDPALFLELFHFLRPWCLALLPVIGLMWWQTRRRLGGNRTPRAVIAPHLAQALTVGRSGARRFLPIDGIALMLALAGLGAAGPTWSRLPDPFVAQTAPLVIALKVTESMLGKDLPPSRLERSKQKIRDLLALRAGARSALVAYAGTAHLVVPMTEDPDVLQPYLEGLQVDVMPDIGNNTASALELAQAVMAKEPSPGGILFVTDDISAADAAALNGAQGASLAVLTALPEGTGSAGIDALNIPVQPITIDDSDVRALDRTLNAAYRRALAKEGDQPWDDRGWWLAWPAALLGLIWFRRGWTMRWGAAVLLGALLQPASPARAAGITDWFLTPDQQGQIAYDHHQFKRAGELFLDPMHRAHALYRDGQYDAAAEVLSALDTADAAFLAGMAHIKGRAYRDAITDFQTTLARDPDFPGAAQNLELAKRILAYVEDARVASDTGEDSGIGADEVVFDNKDAKGVDTQTRGDEQGTQMLTADQWMNTVDTDTGDFLRQKFAIEAAQR